MGDYPAPKSKNSLRDYQWFCLDHIRDFNKKWDYLAGMNATQIEEFVRQSMVGDRPTQSIRGGGKEYEAELRAKIMREFGVGGGAADPHAAAYRAGFTAEQVRALKKLDLAPTRDMQFIKERYRKLAKKWHPDANGGSRIAEEKLKVINEAYGVLKVAFAKA